MKVQYSHLKRRNKKFVGEILPYESFVKKSKSPCFYCGIEHSKEIEDRFAETKSKKKLSNTVVKINGIDRLDSTIGYTEENTVPCCKTCNLAKNTMKIDEFKKWVKRIYEHFVK